MSRYRLLPDTAEIATMRGNGEIEFRVSHLDPPLIVKRKGRSHEFDLMRNDIVRLWAYSDHLSHILGRTLVRGKNHH